MGDLILQIHTVQGNILPLVVWSSMVISVASCTIYFSCEQRELMFLENLNSLHFVLVPTPKTGTLVGQLTLVRC